jgi:hypothetical protein
MKNLTTLLYKILGIFLLIGIFYSCKKEDDEYAINNTDGITINSIIFFKNIDSLSIEADGATKNTISIQINPEADLTNREVSLTTTIGKFSNDRQTDTVIPNASGVATFTITSEIPEIARISASIKSYKIDTVLNFRPSLPHEILLYADKYIADTSQSITLTVDLIRNSFKGVVTDPVKVFFAISPLSSQTMPLIYPTFGLSSNGKAIITITNPFFVKGNFSVEAKSVSAIGDTLRRQIIFKIQ